MWWNWYNFKALFRKIFRGRQKTGQNITLVLDKRHFEIKPSLTETFTWTLRFHINKIVTTYVENTTNDRLLTVISQNKYLFNASQKFQVQYAANVDNTDRTVYVTVAEEDGRFWSAKCCRRLFWLSRATISKCKEKFQSVNQTDRILVISIISMIIKFCFFCWSLMQILSYGRSGGSFEFCCSFRSYIQCSSHFVDVSRLLNWIPVACWSNIKSSSILVDVFRLPDWILMLTLVLNSACSTYRRCSSKSAFENIFIQIL